MITKLKWIHVESSAINAVAYNRQRKVLHVEFRQGIIYSYDGIGYHRFRRLITADSVGKYFNEAIRPRKEKNERVRTNPYTLDLSGPTVGYKPRV